MKCPLCKHIPLAQETVSEPLAMHCCAKCEGKWLSSTNYWSWLDTLEGELPEKEYSDFSYEVSDSKTAKICPDCGRILIKYKVGHGLNFKLDHCNGCNGVWFDKNEWEMLERKNLHDEVHKIFTTSWQNQVRQEEKNSYFNKSYKQKFGDDYPKLKEFKAWLDAHELKPSILAFLTDPKPYE